MHSKSLNKLQESALQTHRQKASRGRWRDRQRHRRRNPAMPDPPCAAKPDPAQDRSRASERTTDLETEAPPPMERLPRPPHMEALNIAGLCFQRH
jgi:hypothetical protein